jgi:hypothetical protein
MALRRQHLVWVEMGPEWRTVRAALEREGGSAARKLSDAVEDAAGPIIAKVQRAALSLPAYGPKHTGLRGRLAAGVRVQPTHGKSVRIVATAEPDERGLPRGMDNGPRGFRHPVYGNRDVWVQQRGGSWFKEPIAEEGDMIERRLTNVLEQMADNIANAGRITGRI